MRLQMQCFRSTTPLHSFPWRSIQKAVQQTDRASPLPPPTLGPQPGDQSDSLGVGKGSAVTKERRLSTGLLPGGESHQDAIEAVRLKLAELAAPTAVPGEEDWLGIGEELPVTSEAAAANERRRRETERYRMASDELFLAQTPEEIARAAMAGRGGDESLGELAQFGYLGGGKINTQLINEAETNKLINAGKLTATETAAAVEVGTVSGRPGKQKITFRNVQPSTFTGRGFHTTPGVVALEISECAKLADLPGVIALMPNLRTLEVMKNRLEELPAGVGKLSKLELLDCRWDIDRRSCRLIGDDCTSLTALCVCVSLQPQQAAAGHPGCDRESPGATDTAGRREQVDYAASEP